MKLGAESYVSPNTTAFITAERVRIRPLLLSLWGSLIFLGTKMVVFVFVYRYMVFVVVLSCLCSCSFFRASVNPLGLWRLKKETQKQARLCRNAFAMCMSYKTTCGHKNIWDSTPWCAVILPSVYSCEVRRNPPSPLPSPPPPRTKVRLKVTPIVERVCVLCYGLW